MDVEIPAEGKFKSNNERDGKDCCLVFVVESETYQLSSFLKGQGQFRVHLSPQRAHQD